MAKESTQDTAQQTRPMPYLDEQGDLVIPFDAPPKYCYWREGGQSIWQTLAELNAPPAVLRKYERQTESAAKKAGN